MISHAGSLSRPGRSSGSAIESLAIGAVRSAILTYFGLVAMRRTETTERGLPDVASSAIVALSRHALSGAFEPYRVLARDAKAQRANGRRTSISAAGKRRRTDPHGGDYGRQTL